MRPESSSTSTEVTSYDGESMTLALSVVADGLVVGEIHYFSFQAVNDVGSSYLSDETSIAIAPLPS